MKTNTALGLLLVAATGGGGGSSSSSSFASAQQTTCPPPFDDANRDPTGASSAAALLDALGTLRDHITAAANLTDVEIDDAKNVFLANMAQLTSSLNVMEAALDLVDDYETRFGPMFIGDSSVGGFSRTPFTADGHELERAVVAVQQGVLDEIYHGSIWDPIAKSNPLDRPYGPIIEDCASVLQGRKWLTSDFLPGGADPPADSTVVHSVQANVTFPAVWGRPVTFTTPEKFSRRIRPLGGLYLSPGQIATVAVPPEMVNANFTIQVGSQTVNNSNKNVHRRMDRITTTFPIASATTYVANPLGGGLYVRIPHGCDLDVVTVSISGGVVTSPTFQMTSIKTTTEQEWDDLRLNAMGPWVDIESEAFLLTLPKLWVYGFSYDHMHTLLSNYTAIMEACSEIVGIPPDRRNNYILYLGVAPYPRTGGYGIGYPQANDLVFGTPDGPKLAGHHGQPGQADSWMVLHPMAKDVAYHELGHAQKYGDSCYKGEKESIVHVPYTYARNVVWGDDIDAAFSDSINFKKNIYRVPVMSIDQAAVDWMVRENFRAGNEMDVSSSQYNEVRYQHRGHGKYADMGRLLGWQVIKDFYYQEHIDYMEGNERPCPHLGNQDSRTLRFSVAAGQDLTPLIHFWGLHPEDAPALKQCMVDRDLYPSAAVKRQLLRYITIVPMNQTSFIEHFDATWINKRDVTSGCGSVLYGCGWYNEWYPKWNETLARESVDAVLDIIFKYWNAADACAAAPPTGRRMVRGGDAASTGPGASERTLSDGDRFDRAAARTDLADARRRWTSAPRPNYNFELERDFYGPDEEKGPFLVEVRSGQVSSVVYKESGLPVDVGYAADIPTADGLFDYIEQKLDRDGGSVYESARYHPEMGYAEEVFVSDSDEEEGGEGEEIVFDIFVRDFTILEVSNGVIVDDCLPDGSGCNASDECCSGLCHGDGRCVVS